MRSQPRNTTVTALLPLLLLVGIQGWAIEPDNHKHARQVGFTIFGGPTRQLVIDEYERKWLHGKDGLLVGAEMNLDDLSQDAFCHDYNYPTLSFGAKLSLNYGVTMRRTEDPAWGMAEMVDYDSRLGNSLTFYGAFDRPLFRGNRWQLGYTLRTGLAIGNHPYDQKTNVDNELIGSRLTIYVGLGLTGTYQLSDQWSLMGGILYGHHSNGALARPNKGENHIAPIIGIRHTPASSHSGKHPIQQESDAVETSHSPHWLAHLRLGVGGKTLHEEWQQTQFRTPPGEEDYRTEHFHFYTAYSLSADIMRRYARRWASGIGAELFYGSYYNHIPMNTSPTSPWSVGIAARHEAYYHQLSVDMALGVYLFRRMGEQAKAVEKPYYERIGLSYSFPRMGGLSIGFSIKAHLTKADLTEIVVAYPFRLFTAAPKR